jgi:peptidoglycan hydrolase-like protein with peptidoglycan-binding domain
MSASIYRPHPKSLKLLAGTAVAALLIGWTAGVGAQTNPEPPAPQQASLPAPTANLPSLPLGHDDVREVQNQLISLGFDPGPADGQVGPGTLAAAQQYDQSRGGNGRASVDGELLARLKADTAPRLTYEQVAARAQARQPAHTASSGTVASAPASGASQFGGIVQQIVPLIGAAIANSNNNNNYGPGYYGPRYGNGWY